MGFVGLLIAIIFGSVFSITGLVVLLFGKRRLRNYKQWKRTNGVIIKKEKSYTINISTLISGDIKSKGPDERPTVQYNIDGITYENTSTIGQKPGFMPGSEVDVLYNPNNPKEAVIDSFVQRGSFFILFGWFIISFGIIAALVTLIVVSVG